MTRGEKPTKLFSVAWKINNIERRLYAAVCSFGVWGLVRAGFLAGTTLAGDGTTTLNSLPSATEPSSSYLSNQLSSGSSPSFNLEKSTKCGAENSKLKSI